MWSSDNPTNRWVERPWAAWAIRIGVYAVPLGMSIAASLLLTSTLAGPRSMAWSVVRWVLIVAVSTAVLVATERISRRLLPLATLLKLSLAFPDRVPSRFRLALRIGTTAQLQQRIQAAQRGDIAESPGEAAERLLELVGLLSHHDRLTRGHSERVRAYTHLVGVEMGFAGDELDRLRWSALLHDIGKITVSADILNKPGRLTDEEFDAVKTHPMEGRTLVEPIADWLGDAVRAVWEHHERVDGGGYPQGLSGSEISLPARIVCVTDAFDVMTSTRSYKKPMTANAARAELSRCAGTQFDPVVVRAFIAASIGSTQTVTRPLAVFSQLLLFPRSFLANATAVLGTTAALTAGAIVGTVGHRAVAERPEASSRIESVSDEVLVTTQAIVPQETTATATALLSPSGAHPDGTTAPTTQPMSTAPAGIPSLDSPLPETSVPPVTLPPITFPPITLPPIAVPSITVPPLDVPSISLPPIAVSPVTLPGALVPPISVQPIVVPPISVPPITLPPITLPSVPF